MPEEMQQNENTIGAVMVLYKPDWSVTDKAIESLASQVDLLCLVDNTPNADYSEKFKDKGVIKYIPLSDNKGIAAAQNIGVNFLIQCNYKFVVFSDQDSIASTGIVHGLKQEYELLKSNGINVGLVGPTPINKVTGEPYENKAKYMRDIELDGHRFTECQSIISSYSFISLDLFEKIGPFLESLFIDFVENEWCFRLYQRLGLSSYLSRNLLISHELGVSKRFMGRQISISSPFRLYFQIRNFFWLNELSYTPEQWRKQVRNKLLYKLMYYPIIPSKRLEYVKSIYKGLKDGLTKKRTFKKYSK